MKKLLQFINRLEKKDKAFVSDLDNMLIQFDEDNPKRSASQLAEIAKHRDIFTHATDCKVKW